MDEKAKKKRPRKKQPLIEWISDYLRYIILIAAILVVILLVVFIVKAVKGSKSADLSSAKTAVTFEEKKEPSENVKEVKADTGVKEEKAMPTNTPTPEATPVPTEEPTPEPVGETESAPVYVDTYDEAHDNIYNSIAVFINAAADLDSDTASTVCMNLSDEERNLIESGAYHAGYTDLDVRLYDGSAPNEYVAVFSFVYIDRETGAVEKGMDTRYMVKGADGQYKFASDDVVAANQPLIDFYKTTDDYLNYSAMVYS